MSITADYPHTDLKSNPHLDIYSRDYLRMDLKKTFAKRVQEYRTARKWNQQQLAKRAGVSQSTVSRAESGESAAADLDTIGKLAEAFGVSPWQLLSEDDIRTLTKDDAAILDAVKRIAGGN